MKGSGTPFRTSQARDVLEGLELWVELELAREDLPEPTSTPTSPGRAPVMTDPVVERER